MSSEKIKENIKKVAYFAIKAQKIGPIWSFESLQKELGITKIEIIEILDLFRKAKFFDYHTIPWNPNNEDYDIFPTKEMIEDRTGGFVIGDSEIIKQLTNAIATEDAKFVDFKRSDILATDEKKLQELIDSPKKLNLFVKQFHRIRGLPTFVGDKIIWGDTELPVERGHGVMMNIFFENPTIILPNEKVQKKGTPVERIELERAVPYNDEDSFRSALKKLRKKLKEAGLPMTIKNFSKNKYLLEIRKVDE